MGETHEKGQVSVNMGDVSVDTVETLIVSASVLKRRSLMCLGKVRLEHLA